MTLTPIKVFTSEDINALNTQLWSTIYNKGADLHFGSIDEPKDAKEIFAIVQLHGKALKDLYDGKLPKGWRFGEASQKIYIKMLKDPDPGEQPYTYGERLNAYPADPIGEYVFDQMYVSRGLLRDAIEDGVQSNRIVGILWHPYDTSLKDPPCFNWFQLRLSEGNKISLRVLFRSHDYGNACFANWGAIIRCFVDEVIKPACCELEELICVSASAHIYNNDFDMIEPFVGKVPEHMKRFL
jgi:thymidylate synthase